MDDSDEALMARIARGDELEFRELARRRLAPAIALARRITVIAAAAAEMSPAGRSKLADWPPGPRP